MTSSIDTEPWDIIQSPTTMPSTIQDNEKQPIASSVEPKPEVTINPTPSEPAFEKKDDTPQLKRNETMDSVYTDRSEFLQRGASRPMDFLEYDELVPPPRMPRAARRIPLGGPPPPGPPPRRYHYSPSPQGRTPRIDSSTVLLDHLTYDGVADLPFPGKSSIYLTNFPFSDRDVQEWSWLFKAGVEDKLLHKRGDVPDDDAESEDDWYGGRRGRTTRPPHYQQVRRCHSPIYDNTVDIPSVYLSRALDPAVIPEQAEKEFTYAIVVKNRGRGGVGGAKLLAAGSRKAAGIHIFYEALIGNSVVFVGAMKKGFEKGKKTKFVKVDGVDAAVRGAEEGVVGVIC